MKFLLDTHCFLWFFLSPHKISMSVQEIIMRVAMKFTFLLPVPGR